MKKRLSLILLVIISLFILVGCHTDEKEEISMYLWDKGMCKELTPWLEKEFPDIQFNFVVGYNTMDYYIDLNNRGDLPDIITCRRFSLNDAVALSDSLLDMQESNIVASYYDTYIENNRAEDGSIRWLPMCAEVDGYIANIDLFNQYQIKVPTNYQEFKEACQTFDSLTDSEGHTLGIRGYINDYREDYSCLEALQGSSIPLLMETNGRLWRRDYENQSGHEVGLDDEIWPIVFDQFATYLEDTNGYGSDLELTFAELKTLFKDGKLAIMRATASDCYNLNIETNINTKMLPYFGQTEENNWLLTYPNCQLAINKKVADSSEKYNAVKKVLEKIFSEEGQRKLSPGSTVLSYNKNVNLELNSVFDLVKKDISANHLYMRLASTDFFAYSKTVVQKMINNEINAQEAYNELDDLLKNHNHINLENITTQEAFYDYKMQEHGSLAASSVANTLREYKECDIAIGYSNFITTSIYKGTYNSSQINWILSPRVLLREGELTGLEIKMLMKWLVEPQEGNNPVRHSNLLPVTSGMEYTVIANGDGTYALDNIMINGNLIDDETIYKVMILGDNNFIEAEYYSNCIMPIELKEKLILKKDKPHSILAEALSNNQQFKEPNDYLTISHKIS